MRLSTDDVSWREVEGEVVVLDERTWTYIHLNGTASILWKAIASGEERPESLVAVLVSNYPEVDENQAASDVAGFVDDLRGRGYLAS